MSHIFRSSLLLAFFFGIDKVFGLVRQVLVARQFGLTYDIDVFNAANNIPDLLSALISGGALGVALIPVLSEYLENKGLPDTWQLFSRILNLAFLATGLLALVIALFAQPLVKWVIAPGFPLQQQAITVELMRLDLVAIIIFSISGMLMAGLQANQHFLLPAMAPVLYNLGQIFGVAILASKVNINIGPISLPAYRMGIHGLVYGVILGASLHLMIQIPGLIKYRFRWSPDLALGSPGVRQVLVLLGPRILTMFFTQLFFITRDNLASGLGEGAISALNYGWFIMQVPETLIGTTIAIVLLPSLASYIARGEQDKYRQTLNSAMCILLAFTIPTAALLAVGVPPLSLVLGFDASGTMRVVWATRVYLLGMTTHALLEVTIRSFYARQDARTPLLAAALNAAAYIFFAVLFSRLWGYLGIAFANVISFTLELLLLLWLLKRHLPGTLHLGNALLRALIAAGLGAFIVYAVLHWLPLPELPKLGQFALGMAAIALGGIAILPLIWKEVRTIIKL